MQQRHLQETEAHIVLGEGHIAKQINIIAELERHQHDASRARLFLSVLEATQAAHVEHRDRILAELGETD